jgi:D-serine deaminase-like pyridoxal phosphate-dependent protein
VYGLPVYPGVLPRLTELRKKLTIILLVDNEQQITMLEGAGAAKPWDIFIKLDVGSSRAGVTARSPQMAQLVESANQSSAVSIYGFYCHAGHSYGGRSRAQAETTLQVELESVLDAAKLLPAHHGLVLSVGSTPTAHVVESLKASAPENVKLELHAGSTKSPCSLLGDVVWSLTRSKKRQLSLQRPPAGIHSRDHGRGPGRAHRHRGLQRVSGA